MARGVKDLDSRELEQRRFKTADPKDLEREQLSDDKLRSKIPVKVKAGKRFFIQHSNHHPSDFRSWAELKRVVNEDGTYNIDNANAAAEQISDPNERAHRKRQINLVATLRKVRRNPVHKD